MKHAPHFIRLLAVAMLTIALPAFAADDAGRIRAGTKSWVESFNSGNAGAVTALYSEEAVLMPPGEPPARGTAAIKEAIAKEIAGAKKGGVGFALGTGDDVSVSGDMAWHSGAYFVLDKSGKTVEAGKYLEVWERKNGKWRIVRDMWSSNGSVPAASAAPAAAPAPAPAAAPKKK
jgi:ketosteroid isomerase-like protein